MKWRRSLTARLAMTHFLLVLAFQAVAMTLAFRFVVAPLLQSSVHELVALLDLSVRNWQAQPAPQRAQYAALLARGYGFTLQAASVPQDSAPGLLPYGRVLQDALRQRFGSSASVRLEHQPAPVFILDIPMQDQRLRISFPRGRTSAEPYPAILLTLLFSAGLGLAAAIVLARRLTRPLRELGHAACQVGAGQRPQKVLPQDIAELDALTQAFNHMAREVEQLLNNRTTLLAGVSHDLRSPVARLRMALELARENLAPGHYEAMERYLEQMNRLIADYLDFAQSGTRREPQPVALVPLLQQLCQPAGEEEAVAFSGEAVTVMADPLALERAVGNLVGNALRYGVPPLEVKLSTEGSQAVIRISDHGPGIPASEREKLFQTFTRLESSRNPATGGTGLGLAIVRELCRVYGWEVSLHANAAGGTTARLAVPLA